MQEARAIESLQGDIYLLRKVRAAYEQGACIEPEHIAATGQ